MNAQLLDVAPEVADALAAGRPVVALESTLITHGMPHPHNLQAALAVEQAVRERGAVPATIALLDGRLVVGVQGDALERLANHRGAAAKASRRDLAALLHKRAIAGTTVATTMQIAALAGIAVFATGGIGGVHRGAEQSFDVSADLLELASTPVAVVCAGAKSILDIAKTLEVLETHGVPVLGYRCDDFPAFFARSSGHPVDHRFDTPEDIAAVIALQRRLGMTGGVLVANPIPEADALDGALIEQRIAQAVDEAEALGIKAEALTPYLLQRINELTGGQSLQANIALIRHNAAVAADIAVALVNPG
jgi:pseudouridine-5'-phosphate glycosidase